jgi:hypothetical protein
MTRGNAADLTRREGGDLAKFVACSVGLAMFPIANWIIAIVYNRQTPDPDNPANYWPERVVDCIFVLNLVLGIVFVARFRRRGLWVLLISLAEVAFAVIVYVFAGMAIEGVWF